MQGYDPNQKETLCFQYVLVSFSVFPDAFRIGTLYGESLFIFRLFFGVALGGISYMVRARVWNGVMDFDPSEDVPICSD
jgi:Gpi18-like mannosyltransferase